MYFIPKHAIYVYQNDDFIKLRFQTNKLLNMAQTDLL